MSSVRQRAIDDLIKLALVVGISASAFFLGAYAGKLVSQEGKGGEIESVR